MYWVFDNFLPEKIALQISSEFPSLHSYDWYEYDGPFEKKKQCGKVEALGEETKKLFDHLSDTIFVQHLEALTDLRGLIPDRTLRGAGYHLHETGSHLNLHKDCSYDPVVQKHRRLNAILYLTPEWDYDWGGNLELWAEAGSQPVCPVKVISPRFNRLVVFMSDLWHGFPSNISCPSDIQRKSFAMYYHTEVSAATDMERKRALFVPRDDQRTEEFKQLAKERSM